jgi:hypothetical protein
MGIEDIMVPIVLPHGSLVKPDRQPESLFASCGQERQMLYLKGHQLPGV